MALCAVGQYTLPVWKGSQPVNTGVQTFFACPTCELLPSTFKIVVGPSRWLIKPTVCLTCPLFRYFQRLWKTN